MYIQYHINTMFNLLRHVDKMLSIVQHQLNCSLNLFSLKLRKLSSNLIMYLFTIIPKYLYNIKINYNFYFIVNIHKTIEITIFGLVILNISRIIIKHFSFKICLPRKFKNCK